MRYQATKFYPNIVSCAFRQHLADSHCSFLHGYGLSVRLIFEADQLDHRNWVIDFGGLKAVKAQIEERFDHRTIVAFDDPQFPLFQEMHAKKIIQLRGVEKVGCEAFAKEVFDLVDKWLKDNAFSHNPRLASVEIMEHPGNSALYKA